MNGGRGVKVDHFGTRDTEHDELRISFSLLLVCRLIVLCLCHFFPFCHLVLCFSIAKRKELETRICNKKEVGMNRMTYKMGGPDMSSLTFRRSSRVLTPGGLTVTSNTGKICLVQKN